MKPERVFQVCRYGFTQGLPCCVLAGKELIGGNEVDGAETDADLVRERMAGQGVVCPGSLCTYTGASQYTHSCYDEYFQVHALACLTFYQDDDWIFIVLLYFVAYQVTVQVGCQIQFAVAVPYNIDLCRIFLFEQAVTRVLQPVAAALF